MLSLSAPRRGRSAAAKLEHKHGLSSSFRDRKPAKLKAASLLAKHKTTTRKKKIYKCHNLKIECFIDNG